jgi:hypothetical protein
MGNFGFWILNGGFWMVERRWRQPLRSVDLWSTWTVGREGMADGGFWMMNGGFRMLER